MTVLAATAVASMTLINVTKARPAQRFDSTDVQVPENTPGTPSSTHQDTRSSTQTYLFNPMALAAVHDQIFREHNPMRLRGHVR
jgi:hypothetical protein